MSNAPAEAEQHEIRYRAVRHESHTRSGPQQPLRWMGNHGGATRSDPSSPVGRALPRGQMAGY